MAEPSREELAREIELQAENLASWTSTVDRLGPQLRDAQAELGRAKINLRLAVRALRDWTPPPDAAAETHQVSDKPGAQ